MNQLALEEELAKVGLASEADSDDAARIVYASAALRASHDVEKSSFAPRCRCSFLPRPSNLHDRPPPFFWAVFARFLQLPLFS